MELTIFTQFLSIGNPTRANVASLFDSIGEAFKFMGIDSLNAESVLTVSGRPVLVGGG